MRTWALAALMSFPAPSSAQSKGSFQEKVEAAAAGPALQDASWGVSVRFADTGERVAAYNAERNLVPASSIKLLATAAAWSALGEDHRFKTRVCRSGGDLVLVGGGDPALGSTLVKGSGSMEEVFAAWIRKIRESGIKSVEGGVLADNRLHPGLPAPGSWTWEDLGNYYAAPADALSISDNLYKVFFAPGAKEGEDARLLRTEPEIPGMRFVNFMKTGAEGSGDNGYVFGGPGQYTAALRGTVPAGPKEFSIKGSLPEPALFAAQAFKRRLEAEGIPVAGEPKLAEGPARCETVLAETVSPPLRDIITVTHKRSFNLYAELLARALAVRRGKPGTLQEGLDAIKDFLRGAGIGVAGLRLFDACGLSRSNQVKAETLTAVLAFMAKRRDFDSWRGSLVFPGDADSTGHIRKFAKGQLEGRLWIKSGSLSGVRGYSGYLRTRAGRLLAFTFIVNNYSSSPAEIEELHESLLVELSKL